RASPRVGRGPGGLCPTGRGGACRPSISIMFGLEGAAHREAEVLRLGRGEPGELDAELAEVELRDLLVELLREHVDLPLLVLPGLGEEGDLREHLVREAIAHHEARMTG